MNKLSKLICAGIVLSTAAAGTAVAGDSQVQWRYSGRSGMQLTRVNVEEPKTVAIYTDANTIVRRVQVDQQIGSRPGTHGRAGYTGSSADMR